MQTRMEKYYEEEVTTNLRERKNERLYENISNYKVDDYKIETNQAVIDHDARNIDVEQIKKILDTRYNAAPKRRSIVIEEDDDEEAPISLDETREYDINAILEKARSEKQDDYEKERLKKLRDTQFDILKSLSIDELEKDGSAEEPTVNQENDDTSSELMDLINTITTNELISKKEDKEETEDRDIDPLDILTDLKGDENTVIMGAKQMDEASNETSPIMSLTEADKAFEEQKLDLTNTLQFTQSDFDDFNDLKKEVRSSRTLMYVIIAIVSILVVIGLFLIIKKFLLV